MDIADSSGTAFDRWSATAWSSLYPSGPHRTEVASRPTGWRVNTQRVGCYFHMDLSGDMLLALGGFLLLVVGAVVFWWLDRRAEEAPHQEPFTDVLNALPDAVLAMRSVRGSNGAITELRCSFLNEAAERMLGVRAVDLVGQSIRKKLPSMAGTEHFSAYTTFIDHDIRPDRFVRSAHGDPERWMERSVGRYGDGLVLLLKDVTDPLRNQRVQRMEEQLVAQADAASAAAHDLRDPMTNLALVEDQLREELHDRPEAVPNLDMLRRNVDRLREMTDAMVHVNRLPDVELKPVDVGALLREVLGSLAKRAHARQVEMRSEVDIAGSVIPADAPLLRAALDHIGTSVIDLLSDGDILLCRCWQRGEELLLSLSVATGKAVQEQGDRVMRQAYRPVPAGAQPPLGHAHGILLAHGALLEMEMPRTGGIVWLIAFPMIRSAG